MPAPIEDYDMIRYNYNMIQGSYLIILFGNQYEPMIGAEVRRTTLSSLISDGRSPHLAL
jgi:hypothetical protein